MRWRLCCPEQRSGRAYRDRQQWRYQESDWQKLNDAKAIIFGAPTYMGSVPWQFKKFADATSKAWFVRSWQDNVFAGFRNSASLNGDKHVSL